MSAYAYDIARVNDTARDRALDPFKPVGKKELSRTDFMTLFITQLQYQDPMKPMDSYEMASQLAQFSNMEATMKMSDNMEQLLEYQVSQNNLQLITLLGTTVQTFGNEIGVSGGVPSNTEFTLADSTENCEIEIYDAAENLVRTIYMGTTLAGTYELKWDGEDMAGEQVEDGIYRYVINALDETGQEIEVDYRTTGKVTGLNFESGQAMVRVDRYIDVSVSEIVRVSELAAGGDEAPADQGTSSDQGNN